MDTIDFDYLLENAITAGKLVFALSPIITIGLMLAFGREDEEEERKKKELGDKLKSCKS